MIITFFLSAIVSLAGAIFSFLPSSSTLPWGLDSIMVTGVAGFKAFAQVFPPVQVVFNAFLIYLGWRLAVMLLKLILGSRSVAQ